MERPQKVVNWRGKLSPIEQVPHYAWNEPPECDAETAATLDPKTPVVLLEVGFVDEEIPLGGGAESEGGTHDLDNLQVLCRLCNRRKGPLFGRAAV